MKNYNKNNIPIAQSLRKNMTDWERHLWYDFLCDYPVKFKKQQPIGNYIVDFYCAKAKLIIELDGKFHYMVQEISKNDVLRQQELENMGFRVIRFPNSDVSKNFKKVCECIHIEVKKGLGEI
jgi:very-short-patch-repair endonuclease